MRNATKVQNERVDLHLHSICSDGKLSAAELVELAHKSGLRAISLTDHDNMACIGEAAVYGRKLGVEVIPGVELSTSGYGTDTHILGYFIDTSDRIIVEHLKFFRQQRIKRARQIVEKLHELGCSISFADVMHRAGKGSVGRPHIAEAMVECGFVASSNEAFIRYLADNKPAFVPKYKISSAKAIWMIEKAGGLSFLAHPGRDTPDGLMVDLIKQGLSGIETIHPRHSEIDILHYRGIVQRYGILETGGSDFHVEDDWHMIGKYVLPYTTVIKMKDRLSASLAPESANAPEQRLS